MQRNNVIEGTFEAMGIGRDDIRAEIDFLADIPLYEQEKPFHFHAPASMLEDEDKIQTTNIQWDSRTVVLHSMRDDMNLTLEKNGFSYVQHESEALPYDNCSMDVVHGYKAEAETLLRQLLDAVLVRCYDYKRRKNSPMTLEAYDPRSQLVPDQVAVGAHDISLETVGPLINNLLTEEERAIYCNPEYRFRLINTWRSTLPEVDDRPLALCSYPSIDIIDLIATDRVYPVRLQEIYYLKYNKKQKWYWLPNQRSNEPFVFMTYDSLPGSGNARYCPHVSFNNPTAQIGAPKRESVETRNLVITKM